MRLLVTRPQPDADQLKADLTAAGHDALLEPLLTMSHSPPQEPDLADAQALVVTSRNGLRATADQTSGNGLSDTAMRLPLFAVGPGSAELARTMGFTDVHQGPGTVRDLLPLLTEALAPQDGTIVHLAGDRVSFDLTGALREAGYSSRKVQVYRSNAAADLSEQTKKALSSGTLDGVILMSPRTAKVWTGLVIKAGLEEPVRGLRHICLAETVATRLERLQDVNIVVANRPNAREILALVNRLAAQSG